MTWCGQVIPVTIKNIPHTQFWRNKIKKLYKGEKL